LLNRIKTEQKILQHVDSWLKEPTNHRRKLIRLQHAIEQDMASLEEKLEKKYHVDEN